MACGTRARGVPCAGRWCRVPRRGVRRAERRAWRGGVQHRHERLPGDTDGSVVRGTVRHPHHRRGRQLRNKRRGRGKPRPLSVRARDRRPDRAQQLAQREEPRRLPEGERRARHIRGGYARVDDPPARARQPQGVSPHGRVAVYCDRREGGRNKLRPSREGRHGQGSGVGGAGWAGLCSKGDVQGALRVYGRNC